MLTLLKEIYEAYKYTLTTKESFSTDKGYVSQAYDNTTSLIDIAYINGWIDANGRFIDADKYTAKRRGTRATTR